MLLLLYVPSDSPSPAIFLNMKTKNLNANIGVGEPVKQCSARVHRSVSNMDSSPSSHKK